MMWKSDPRPIESVVTEIKSLRSKLVIFYDPNFFARRDYALKLMRALKPLKILWAANATISATIPKCSAPRAKAAAAVC